MSVYSIIELVGTSPTSWEDAARSALVTASKTLEDLRVAEVIKQDVIPLRFQDGTNPRPVGQLPGR